MLGELAHLDGRWRRIRFAFGCTCAALIMPPWGRATAGIWATVRVTAASVAIYTGLAIQYRLGVGDWIALAVFVIICAGYLLGTSALLRRPGVALPGVLGGGLATLVWLALSGLTAVDQVTFIPTGWQKGVTMLAVPAVIGATATLWRHDPAAGRRAARLAALSAGLLQLLYATAAVAVLGGGGPPDADGGYTVPGTVSDRLGNNVAHLAINTVFIALVGWAAAALTGHLIRRTPAPATRSKRREPHDHTGTAPTPSHPPHPDHPRHRSPDRTRRQPPTPQLLRPTTVDADNRDRFEPGQEDRAAGRPSVTEPSLTQ